MAEEVGDKKVLGACVFDEGGVEVAEWDLGVVGAAVFVCGVGGQDWGGAVFERVDAAADVEGVVGGGGGGLEGWEEGVAAGGFVVADGVVFVHCVEFEFLEGGVVARKVGEVVPTHGVDVGLADFFGELGVVRRHEEVELFVADEALLLDDLSICAGDSEGFDLGDEEVADSLDCLGC